MHGVVIERRRPLLALVGLMFAVLLSVPAAGQDLRSNTRGLLLGINLGGGSLKVENGDAQSGGGGGLTLGWGISRQVAIILRGDVANYEITDPDIEGSYGVGVADLGVRISFGAEERMFLPFIIAALSVHTAAADVTTPVNARIEISGPGFTLGGGFNHYFNPRLALDVGLLLTSGRFDSITIGSISADIGKLDSQVARLIVGLNWFPVTPR